MDTYTTFAGLAHLLSTQGLLTSATQGADDVPIGGADCDSRMVQPGHLFVCKGASFRPAYLVAAQQAGAVAYLCDEEHADQLAAAAPDLPRLVTGDVRRAMALVSAEAFGHPDRSLKVVGITGTKGKSTTSYMLRSIIEGTNPYSTCGLVGSIETYDGVERAESLNTTPESPDLWRHLAHMRDTGLSYAVMEVSSQALKYDRVDGLGLDVACFLNIGRDHISPLEHPTWEDYFASKLRIFDQARTALVNLDSDHVDTILDHAHRCQRVVTFSATQPSADVWASNVQSGFGFVTFDCHTPSWEGPITLSMPGLFNVDNALAAIAIAEVLGIGYEQVVEGLVRTKVPGRMELIPSPDRKVVGIVDFAHNRMAFEKFFPSVRQEFPDYHVIAVFGATGDKAVERRHELPQVAGKYADLLIFTKDDPGHERVEDICAQMAQSTPAGVPHETIPDRAAAVQRAVDLGYQWDGHTVVCVLARGTESVQHENGGFTPAPLDADLFNDAVRHRLSSEGIAE